MYRNESLSMQPLYPFTQFTTITPTPSQISYFSPADYDYFNTADIDDVTPNSPSHNSRSALTTRAMNAKRTRREIFYSALLCAAAGLIIGLGAGVGYSISQNMNRLYNAQKASCNPSCANNGVCISTNVCQCASGYNGSTCNTPTCPQACANGNCTAPQTCTCQTGWTGSLCNQPICTSSCLNGNCSNPNTCTCTTGYNGSLCQTPVCNPACINGGTCVAPNTCQCIPDVWTGPICQTPIRIFWSFDNNLGDLYNNYPGVGINNPSYLSPGINGYGACLYLNGSVPQSVTIYTPPFLNMAQTSFTLEAWAFPVSLRNTSNPNSGDNAIFGQFQSNTLDRSLHIIIRNTRIYLGFYADDIQGNQILHPGNWYHMAYVYDYSTLTQLVYVNGVLDVSGSPKGPYQGTTGDLTIGTNGVNVGANSWDGCLDLISYAARAKNATEILQDATLTASLSFTENLIDDGPLGINGSGVNITYINAGPRNLSLSLAVNQSYVQLTGLVLLGTVGHSYSIALWIRPTMVTRGTIVHVSALPSGLGWCIPMLGFTNAGLISAQSWSGSPVALNGPAVVANAWTHVAVTYSSTNGLRLYVNGTQSGSSSGAYNYAAAGAPVSLTIGSSLFGINACSLANINPGQYYGYIDDFGLYSRELTASFVLRLAQS